jgi:hypothetical protein
MTSFEFVFGLVSVVTSLALTQLLSGMVSLYRCADRLTLSWRHACWTATAFMLLIGNWSVFWDMRNKASWGVLDVLVPLVFTSLLYALCDIVMPEKPTDGVDVDLREYHLRQSKRYKTLMLIFSVVVIGAIVQSSVDVADWARKSEFAFAAVAISLVALRARSTFLDTATSFAFVALSGAFMASSLKVLSS